MDETDEECDRTDVLVERTDTDERLMDVTDEVEQVEV